MALTLTTKAVVPASKQLGAQPAPTAAPAPASAPASAGKVSGPFDRFRSSRPDDIPEDWWNSYIDSQNAEHNAIKASDPNWNEQKAQAELSRITPELFAQAVRQNGGASFDKAKNTIAGGSGFFPTESIPKAKSADLSQQIIDLSRSNEADNKQFVDTNVVPRLADADVAAKRAADADREALRKQGVTVDQARSALEGLVKEQRQSTNRYNEWSGEAFDKYAEQQGALNEQDQAALAQYMSETNPLMTQLKARGYGADVAFDPEGLAAQRESFGTARGIAGGSLDYASQGARAYADQNDINAQRAALAAITSDARNGDREQRANLGRILADVETGGREQQEVLDRYKSLSASPQATAQERYLAEIARRSFEAQDRSSREAVMQDLKQRGLNSGTLQIANQLAEQERLGQDRTLAELGLQANAVNRQMAALAGYGDAANALRGSTQAGLGLYSNAAGSMRAGNQAALGMEAGLATDLRNAGFEEAFKRGTAADAASANNQQARVSGAGLMGTQANAIRTANDAINTFNKEQSQIAQRFQDQYAQTEAERVGNLAGKRQTATLDTTRQAGGRNTEVHTADQDMLDKAFNRERDATDLGYKATGDIYKMGTDLNTMGADTGQREFDRKTKMVGTAGDVAGVRSGGGRDIDRIIEALRAQKGDIEAERAEDEL